jgi:hypothetical protein
MRYQKASIIILAAMLPLWGLAFYTRHTTPEPVQPQENRTAKKIHKGTDIAIRLNPKVTLSSTNLNQGYLFNRERFLKSADTDTNANNQKNINMETLRYNGSIIMGTTRQALISYSSGKTSKTAKRVARNTRPNKKKRPTPEYVSMVIALGETIGGYTVSEVEPLQLTFTRGSHTVTKDLFSKEKQRKTPVKQKIKKTTPQRKRQPARRISNAPKYKETFTRPALVK